MSEIGALGRAGPCMGGFEVLRLGPRNEGLTILPHIVLGLHYGQFLGEDHALEMIARYPVSTLILVVLTPLTGTPMEHLPPPPLEDVVDFFAKAREKMVDTRINLGCGRPMGSMKVAMDKAAIDHGLNGIAAYVNSPSFAMNDRLEKSDLELLRSVSSGIGEMPGWGGALSEMELLDAITFIRTLRPSFEAGIGQTLRRTPERYFLFGAMRHNNAAYRNN